MAKKLSDLDFVEEIDSLCKIYNYSLYICKERDDIE